MKRFVLWAWLLLGLTQAVSALEFYAHSEDWPDTNACKPDSVFVHWLDSQNNEGWSYGRVRGPEGSPSVYSFSWCSNIPESQYIPVYSLVSELLIKLNTGVEQYWPVSALFVDCDPAPFPIELAFGTFDACNEMETGLGESILPQSLQLEQNYPNPFNPTTTIKFSLPAVSHVTLAVHNLNGELVSVLANEQMLAGEHQLDFNAGNLSSGIYFYRLTMSNGLSQTQKMTLIK